MRYVRNGFFIIESRACVQGAFSGFCTQTQCEMITNTNDGARMCLNVNSEQYWSARHSYTQIPIAYVLALAIAGYIHKSTDPKLLIPMLTVPSNTLFAISVCSPTAHAIHLSKNTINKHFQFGSWSHCRAISSYHFHIFSVSFESFGLVGHRNLYKNTAHRTHCVVRVVFFSFSRVHHSHVVRIIDKVFLVRLCLSPINCNNNEKRIRIKSTKTLTQSITSSARQRRSPWTILRQ